MKQLRFFLIAVLLSCELVAQERQVSFGFHIEPIIPSRLFRVTTESIRFEDVTFSSTPKAGIAFGGILKFDYSTKLSFETGINYLIRSYYMDATEGSDMISLRFIDDSYEVPLSLKYFIRLGKNTYLSNSVGLSLIAIPGSIHTKRKEYFDTSNDFIQFEQHSFIYRSVVTAFRGGFGLNYRTESIGSFYFETNYRLFSRFYETKLEFQNTRTGTDFRIIDSDIVIAPIRDYFGFSIRYTFPSQDIIKRGKTEK